MLKQIGSKATLLSMSGGTAGVSNVVNTACPNPNKNRGTTVTHCIVTWSGSKIQHKCVARIKSRLKSRVLGIFSVFTIEPTNGTVTLYTIFGKDEITPASTIEKSNFSWKYFGMFGQKTYIEAKPNPSIIKRIQKELGKFIITFNPTDS